jgi:hypothetical protein
MVSGMTAFHASAEMVSPSGENFGFNQAQHATPAKALRSVTLPNPTDYIESTQQALCDWLRGHFPIQPTEQHQ